MDMMSSSNVANPGPSGTRKASASTPPRSTVSTETRRLSMPAERRAGRTTLSSGPRFLSEAPARLSSAATSMSPLMPLEQSKYRIIVPHSTRAPTRRTLPRVADGAALRPLAREARPAPRPGSM